MLRDPSSPPIPARILAPVAIGLALAAIVPFELSARPTEYPLSIDASAASGPRVVDEPQRTSSSVREDDIDFVVFFDEQRTTMSGSSRDMARAKRLKRPGEPMLWFRLDGREYVVRDAAVLREVAKAWEEPNRLGDEQGQVGAKQGAIGTKQGEIGRRQGEIGTEQGVIGTKQGIIGTRQGQLAAREGSRSQTDAQRAAIDAERRELDRQMQDLDREMRKLDERMRELDAPMRELDAEMKVLDREMSALDGRMKEAMKRAKQAMGEILERAISSGAAQAVR